MFWNRRKQHEAYLWSDVLKSQLAQGWDIEHSIEAADYALQNFRQAMDL